MQTMKRTIATIALIAATATNAMAQKGGPDASAWLALEPVQQASVARTVVEHLSPSQGRVATGIQAYGVMKCMDAALNGEGASLVAKQKMTFVLLYCANVSK